MPLDTFRQVFLPYGLEELPGGVWAAFNREYLPLGATTREEAPRQGYKFHQDLTPYLDEIFHHYSKNTEGRVKGWLYNDGCLPDAGVEHMKVYQARLALLSCLANRDLSEEMRKETGRLLDFLTGKGKGLDGG